MKASKMRCSNLNHGRRNITVRYCPTCGKLLNKEIPVRTCTPDGHAIRQREGDNYCLTCGQPLRPAR